MTNRTRLVSGRVVTSNSANVPSDRYQYLDLSSAEPNLGIANVGDVLTYDTGSPGARKWIAQASISGSAGQQAFDKANAAYNQANVTIGIDTTQNTRLTVIENTDVSQNVRLDYSNTAITIIQGTDVSQNARMTIIEGVNASQNVRLDYSNSAIAIIQGTDTTQNTNIAATNQYATSAFSTANNAYNQANTANTPAGSTTQIQFNDGGIRAGNPTLTFDKTTGTFTTSIVASTNNGNGTNFKVGDDIWIGDVNSADTMRLTGQQNTNNAYIIFGAADAKKLGRSGTGALIYDGFFSANGEISSLQSIGDEGGQINLALAATNTTLTGGVAIDVYQNKLRFFETGGTARGAYIDLSAATAGVGYNLLSGGGGGGGTIDQWVRDTANVTIGVDTSQNSRMTISDGVNVSQNVRLDYSNTAITIIQGVDVGQNTRLTVIEGTDLSQNVSISTQNSFITIIQGTDVSQNSRMAIIEGTDVSQNSRIDYSNVAITIIQGTDVSQNARMTIIENTDVSQNTRIDYSNTAITIIQGTDVSQNSRMTIIEGTDVGQNSRMTIIENTDVSQNVRLDYSNTAITIIQGTDVSQNSRMTIIEGVNVTQNTNITTADTKAQAAFDKANSAASNSSTSSVLTSTVDAFTGNGSNTAFTLSVTPASINYTTAVVGGVMQPRSAYSVLGTTITFTSAPVNGQIVEVTTIGTSNTTLYTVTTNVISPFLLMGA